MRTVPEQNFEQWIGTLLRTGLALVVVVLAGGVAFLGTHGHAPADYRTFEQQPAACFTQRHREVGVPWGFAGCDSVRPALAYCHADRPRRAFAGLFARAGSRLYVVVTLIVLLVLLGSVAASR